MWMVPHGVKSDPCKDGPSCPEGEATEGPQHISLEQAHASYRRAPGPAWDVVGLTPGAREPWQGRAYRGTPKRTTHPLRITTHVGPWA